MLLLKRYLVYFITIFNLFALCCCHREMDRPGMTITEVTPSGAIVGGKVIIRGSGFSTIREENTVTFGGIKAQVDAATSTEIQTLVPDRAQLGCADLVVAREGFVPVITSFCVNEYPLPQVLDIRPYSGPIGTLITIYGKNFGSSLKQNQLMFKDSLGNPLALSPTVSPVAPFTPLTFANSDSIQVKVPQGAGTGSIDIWVFPDSTRKDYSFSVSTPKFIVTP